MLAQTSILILLCAFGATANWKLYFLSPPPDDLLAKCNNGSSDLSISDGDVDGLDRRRRDENSLVDSSENTNAGESETVISEPSGIEEKVEDPPSGALDKDVPKQDASIPPKESNTNGANASSSVSATETPDKSETEDSPETAAPIPGKLNESVASLSVTSSPGLLSVTNTSVASFSITTLVYNENNSINDVEPAETTPAGIPNTSYPDNQTTESQPNLTSNHETHSLSLNNFNSSEESVFVRATTPSVSSVSARSESNMASDIENQNMTKNGNEFSKDAEKVTSLLNQSQTTPAPQTVSIADGSNSNVSLDSSHASNTSFSFFSPSTKSSSNLPPNNSSSVSSSGFVSSSVSTESLVSKSNLDISSQPAADVNTTVNPTTNSVHVDVINGGLNISSVPVATFVSSVTPVAAVHENDSSSANESEPEVEVVQDTTTGSMQSTQVVIPSSLAPTEAPQPTETTAAAVASTAEAVVPTEPPAPSPSTAKEASETTETPPAVEQEKKDFVKYECNADESSIPDISNSVTCNSAEFWSKSCFYPGFGKCQNLLQDKTSVFHRLHGCICEDSTSGTNKTACSMPREDGFSCDESESWKLDATSIMCLPFDLVRECCSLLPTPELKLRFDWASHNQFKLNLTIEHSDLWQVVQEEVKYCIERLEEQPLIQLPPGASAGGSAMQCQRDPLFQGLDPGRCFHVNLQLKFKMRVPTDLRLSSASTSIQSPVCTHPIAPKEVPAPDIDSDSLAIEIYRPPDQTDGKVDCYYVLLLKMAHTETIDDLRVEFLDRFFDEYRRAEKSSDMEKLRPYITMAVPGFSEPSKRIAFSTSESSAAPPMTSCGACDMVNNTLLQPGKYLVVVAAAVDTAHLTNPKCGHIQKLTKKSDYVSMDYVLHHESGFNMWIPIAVLTVILFLSLLVLSLLFFTRNGRCNQMQLMSKLGIGGSNDLGDTTMENPVYSGGLGSTSRGGLVRSHNHSNSNLAILQVNANGFHAIVNPSHHAHLQQQQQLQSGTPYAQVDPQKRQQADNDFRNTLIEEYGPEYLEDRRKCKIELTAENVKSLIERKCTTPHFYYTFYKSRGLPCPGQPLEPEPKYHELTQWDFEFERIAHDGYMEGETPPPQVLNDPSVIKINKFSDVCPYEFNRVKLTYGVKDNPNLDRTNGSLIQFSGLNNRFIAIQGPDQAYYINQFWQIVYEYNCDVIVMLASFNVASGKDGVQYWPDFDDHEGGTQVYGNYTVTMTDKRSIYSYMDHRVFQVTFTPVKKSSNSDGVLIEGLDNDDDSPLPDGADGRRGSRASSEGSGGSGGGGCQFEPGETKIVHHFHFTMWNDYGIPTDTSSFWSFMDTAMSYHDMPECPVLVHCRAGIGRTGTFIASNYLRDLLERDGRVDVHKFVWQLRAQRKKFVQKVCQYRFIHQALLEHILFTRSRLTLSNILNSSFGTTTATGVTGVTPPHSIKANILQQLQDIEFVEKYREHHLEKEKGDYNGREETFPRDFQKVPYKYNFVRFPADIVHEVYSSYLNASWICGFNDELKRFIVTDLPYEVKHKTFWWMVLQHRISYLVYIGDLPMDGQKKETPYWPDTENQVLKFGRINVRLVAKYDFMPAEEMGADSSPTGINNNHAPSGCSKPNRNTKAVYRQLALTVTDDDEMLARGEEWQITHVQYLFLEGSTGPPLNSCHFAHFVSLIRRDLIGSCQQQQQHHRGQLMTSPPPSMTSAPNRRGACNCLLKRRFRDSLMNRCSSNSAAAPDESSLLSCDCSKPLVVQCLTGGLRSALFCAIWILSQDLEQTKSCNVPAVIHRLLEQRFTIFPYRTTDIDCFNFIYDCLKSISSGSFEGENEGSFTSAAHSHMRSPSQDHVLSSSSNNNRSPVLPIGAGPGVTHPHSNNSPSPLYNGHSSSPYTSSASLRLPTPNSPQAQLESLSFSNNLAKNSPSPRAYDPNNPAGVNGSGLGVGQSDSSNSPFSFSTFKKNKNNKAAAAADPELETSIV